MKFLGAFQVLVVAGYENSIPVFNITPRYYDVNVVGRLVGHVSIVTALEVMEGTPMVVSADDTGCIKTWDIRSFQCYQTIEMSHKTIIGQLLNLDNINKVAFIGCRVNFIEFDRSDKFTQKLEV
jgi:WD40 repeat protein